MITRTTYETRGFGGKPCLWGRAPPASHACWAARSSRPPLAGRERRHYVTEPYGSVYADPTGYGVRRALGRHAAWRAGAARTSRRVDHGPCREVPDDAHGHEEARRRSGAGGARHHEEDRARADVPAGPAPMVGRDGVAREVPSALGRTLRRVGQGCRGTHTKGAER